MIPNVYIVNNRIVNGNGECIKETTTQPVSVKAGGECYKNDAFDHICSKNSLSR